ncbi:HlyD family type I secretion periplasmic adaptor subunit [Oxalicibacterium solurbis]|uniref:Membrane fusion protein (MFP) family protein n=1 Tax=Oxalicibacterium solurbis TaxID=69280 RepID=A0A8J3F649_9BURK|nr:HlyD family type I secretion periplasmic adaptor subunit [Oxalicibacterium solurbis]GGI54679.1 HlyD family type I secretion periplasmic adaptor subunit [Oxalicibacterium solurbis]
MSQHLPKEEHLSQEGGNPKNECPTKESADVIQLRPPKSWHDPLQLIQAQTPDHINRIVLRAVCVLVLILIVWATFGKLDIIATAEGKLVTQTLVKIVQPAESGVVRQLLVQEGDSVKAGQVLARLDPTLAAADKISISNDLSMQRMQVRRLEAELEDQPMLFRAGDDPKLYAHVQSQYTAHRQAYLDSLDQEKSLLIKMQHERRSAGEIASKLEQTLPTYRKTAEAYADLAREGYMGSLASAEKQRDFIEKTKDLDAQRATVASLDAAIASQKKRVMQIQSSYKSELEKELAEIRARINQLEPNLDKTIYREGLMDLKAPQDGVIKDLATTTVGAVVQPGTVLMSLVPKGEQLYADVEIKNEDVGFVQAGQYAQIKLAAYPFQKYGMLTGKVIRISADSSESRQVNQNTGASSSGMGNGANSVPYASSYKARVQLDEQVLKGPDGNELTTTPGMQVIAEINQGRRTVLEYLLSPVEKAVQEAGRER